MRKCINLVQMNSTTGKLIMPDQSDTGQSDWQLQMVDLFKAKEFKKARELIVGQARPEEYEDIFRFMYRNLELWGDSEAQRMQAVVTIRDGLVKSVSCADPEINLSATLVELTQIAEAS